MAALRLMHELLLVNGKKKQPSGGVAAGASSTSYIYDYAYDRACRIGGADGDFFAVVSHVSPWRRLYFKCW